MYIWLGIWLYHISWPYIFHILFSWSMERLTKKIYNQILCNETYKLMIHMSQTKKNTYNPIENLCIWLTPWTKAIWDINLELPGTTIIALVSLFIMETQTITTGDELQRWTFEQIFTILFIMSIVVSKDFNLLKLHSLILGLTRWGT